MKTITSRSHIHTFLPGLLLVSVLVDLLWHSYVGFIRDDAFITFRYAANLASGQGFVYNPGEPVYGTSSPGFALLMAAWLFFLPARPVAGALVFNILASTISLFLVWKLLGDLSITVPQRAVVLLVLICSDKLLLHSLEGMETPLVITCMLASFYFLSRERPVLAGIAAGLMLWLRVDSALWILVVAIAGLIHWRKSVLIFLSIATLTYLPWLIFAQLYFGSVIPFTAIAKQVAYGINPAPLINRVVVLYFWMTPFTLLVPPLFFRTVALITYIVAGFGVWTYRRSTLVRVLAVFFVIQSLGLVLMNMTVEQRYFITSLFVLLILFGLGLYALAGSRRWIWLLVGVYAVTAFSFSLPRAQHLRDHQAYVYEGSLKQMGLWLEHNSPSQSVVFLEPLGYVGFYSRRLMLDEVGFATPVVMPLKRAGLDPFQISSRLNPDYVVFHCDDAARAPNGFGYELAVRFDPLGFESGRVWEDAAVQRNACYEIHLKTKHALSAR